MCAVLALALDSKRILQHPNLYGNNIKTDMDNLVATDLASTSSFSWSPRGPPPQ